MLLETLDLKTNDVLIYSQNMFNFNDSFKVIFKNEKIKRPRRVSYFDVCNYVKDPSPKNLVIYRLLTNVSNLDAHSTKYGYFIKINERMELIYFDPIFAIKDLRHLRFELDPGRFRFKIQQVGLTSLTRWESEPNFAEVYCFDLKATEAQHQNDKIFADAIFAIDPNFVDKEVNETLIKEQKVDSLKSQLASSQFIEGDHIINESKISEVKESTQSGLNILSAPASTKAQDLREEIITLLKQALNIPDSAITKSTIPKENIDLTDINAAKTQKGKDFTNTFQDTNLFDLFRTTSKSNELTEREKESVILRFDDE